MPVRMIVTDIDGTITGPDRAVHLGCVDVLRSINRLVPVGLATGNTLYYTESAAVLLGLKGPLIAENGGVVVVEGEIVETPPREEVKAVREFYELAEKELGLRRTEPEGMRRTEVAVYRDVPLEDVVRLLEESGYSDRVEVVDTGFAYHIKTRTASKGLGVEVACERMGIDPEDVVAIGDGDNDVSMLETAGKGVVPANATPAAKSAADTVLDGEDGEAVAEYLRRLLRRLEG